MRTTTVGGLTAIALGVILVLLTVLIPSSAHAATLLWDPPLTYADNAATPIPAAKIATITYTPFYGASSTGPWTTGPQTAPGVTTAIEPNPAMGETRWYTVSATLDGQTGPKTAAASLTVQYPAPGAPLNLRLSPIPAQ